MRGIVKGLFAEMSFFFQMKAFADLKTLAVLLPFAFKNRLPSQTHDIVRRGRRNLTNEFFTDLASHDSRGIPRSPDGTLSDKIVKIFLKVPLLHFVQKLASNDNFVIVFRQVENLEAHIF